MIASLSSIATESDLAEIESVSDAGWWISCRNYSLTAESLPELVGSARLVNQGIVHLKTADESKVASGLRNGGTLEPLCYEFGTMCGRYTHLLTLKNGTRYVVNALIAKNFLQAQPLAIR